MTDIVTADKLIAQNSSNAFGLAHIRKAFIAGYMARELAVREDKPQTQKVAEKAANDYIRKKGYENE